MAYQIMSLGNNPISNKPYELEMRSDPDHYIPFHADIEKLIAFWEFDNCCIPSFLSYESFARPLATFNPNPKKVEERCKFKNILYGDDYAKSGEMRHMEEALSRNPITMPEVAYSNINKPYCITVGETVTKNVKNPSLLARLFSRDKFIQQEVRRESAIKQSDYCIVFGNGRHRTRHFEFLGAKDIWVAIHKDQEEWFNKNCKYQD